MLPEYEIKYLSIFSSDSQFKQIEINSDFEGRNLSRGEDGRKTTSTITEKKLEFKFSTLGRFCPPLYVTELSLHISKPKTTCIIQKLYGDHNKLNNLHIFLFAVCPRRTYKTIWNNLLVLHKYIFIIIKRYHHVFLRWK